MISSLIFTAKNICCEYRYHGIDWLSCVWRLIYIGIWIVDVSVLHLDTNYQNQ